MSEFNYSSLMVRITCNKQEFVDFRDEYAALYRVREEEVGSDEYKNDTEREFKRMTIKAREYLKDIFPNEAYVIETKPDTDIVEMFKAVFNPLGV